MPCAANIMSKVLILYMVRKSGHHSAALTIEKALHKAEPSVETTCLDPLRYMHPHMSAALKKTYMFLIKQTPQVWHAIYDSEHIDRLTRRARCADRQPKKNLKDNSCKAFLKGIPKDILNAEFKHTKKHPDQDNEIVFEKKKEE